MRLPNFNTDFSRFFRRLDRADRVFIPNTVNLMVDDRTFDCSGCMLAQHSPVLLDLMSETEDIYLDQFRGCSDGVQDCVDLLYGADVPIDMDNIKVLFKFSMIYKINGVFGLCLQWVHQQLSINNFFAFCKIGFVIKDIDVDCEDILNYCKAIIKKSTADQLLEVSKSWPESWPGSFVDFLFDAQLLPLSIPTITNWIDSEEKVTIALTNIEEGELQGTLSRHLSQFDQMIAKMMDECETKATSKRVFKLQTCVTAHLAISVARIDSLSILKLLEPKLWRNYDMDQISSLYSQYNLADFFYAEIIVDWISFTKPLKEVVDELWRSVVQENINADHLSVLRNSIISLNSKYMLPICGGDVVYKYDRWNYANSGIIKNKLATENAVQIITDKCEIKRCSITASGCLKTFKLIDGIPCYELGVEKTDYIGHYHHAKIKHWYATEEKNGQDVLLSFVTNSAAWQKLFKKC